MTTQSLTEKDYITAIKDFTRDYPDVNRLLKFKEETAPNIVGLCVNFALSFLNSIPPPVMNFDFGTFPIPSLLVHQAAIEVMISIGICNARNDLVYNNGGITVRPSDREKYLPIIQILSRITDMEINNFKQLKVSINIDGAYGGVSSPYVNISGQLPIRPNSLL